MEAQVYIIRNRSGVNCDHTHYRLGCFFDTAELTSVLFDFGIIGERSDVVSLASQFGFVTHVEYLTMGPPNQAGRAKAKYLTLVFVWCAISAPTSLSCFPSFHKSIVLSAFQVPLALVDMRWTGT